MNQHTSNFINAIRIDEKLNCDINIGSLAAINAHMGNVAFKTRKSLSWDEKLWSFKSNEQANKLMVPKYRMPWVHPV